MITPFHDPAQGPLRCAGFISGSGTNLTAILNHQRALEETREKGSPFKVVVIFSDRADSQAAAIGKTFDLPVVIRDIRAFYEARGLARRDMSHRALYDAETVKTLKPFNASCAVYAGYMSIASPVLVNAFLGVNVHPADLGIMAGNHRKYVGDFAVRDALLAGETTLSSTTHLVEPEVDGGRILMISKPMAVHLPAGVDLHDTQQRRPIVEENQRRLKEQGDWTVFPLTLQYLAEGRFGRDEGGNVHFDADPIPCGLRL